MSRHTVGLNVKQISLWSGVRGETVLHGNSSAMRGSGSVIKAIVVQLVSILIKLGGIT